MNKRRLFAIACCCGLSLALASLCPAAAKEKEAAMPPSKVYVPYDKLKDVFEKEGQGVFLPYEQFQKLWQAAQGRPTDVSEAPFDYLISTAKFQGRVKDELAALRLELTIDLLGKGWVDVPIGLGEAAVSQAEFVEPKDAKIKPLLRLVNGRYVFTAKGKGRYVLALDLVRQLQTQPGLAVLNYTMPSAAITTLELLIPEENLKVDVEPMLAATTSQVEIEKTKATRLQAFLGSANQVRLSWKPTTEAAPELKPVVVCEQFQHIGVAEALINYEARLDYTIRRGGIDAFTIQLPGQFRITDVSGSNIAKWDMDTAPGAGQNQQTLNVKLFSPARDKYSLMVKMERFLQETQTQIPLVPITTTQVLRQSGMMAITCSPRRLVSLKEVKNLARVDTGRLPPHLQNQPGVTAYRFIAADYAATLAVETAAPRITVNQQWTLGVDTDRLQLRGKLRYKIERTGVFELKMNLPEPWKLESIGPADFVDDHQIKLEGDDRILQILLKSEKTGEFTLELAANAERPQPDAPVDFILPLADVKDLQLYAGQLVLLMADHLRAEVEETLQLQAIPLRQTRSWAQAIGGLSPAMAFEFRAIDPQKPAAAKFKIAVKPPQVSAVIYRLVDIQRSSIEDQAVVDYRIRYAPVDTFYLKMPESLADAGVEIIGANIKEKPRIRQLPPDQIAEEEQPEKERVKWAYYKIVLQSKVGAQYQLTVQTRRTFRAPETGQTATVVVEPILAAGKLSDQRGHIAIAKAETLAIGEPQTRDLEPADAASPADLPHEPHRRAASLAFKYNLPTFALSLPVVTQKEAAVFTTIASGAIIEQVLAPDGICNTHAIYLIQTGKGERLPVTLPENAELTAVLLNGDEAAVEIGLAPNERIIRLPPSAGQVSRFVLEISYGLKNVSASNLTAPTLPKEVPVQQTLWRLWIPPTYHLLANQRIFSRIDERQCANVLASLRRNQPTSVDFKLSGQGKPVNFVRQGAAGRFSVLIASRESFNIGVWIIVLTAGLLMLRLSGLHRMSILLAAALLAGVVHLYQPLMIEQIIRVGIFAAILVALLWAGQWIFLTVPRLRKALPKEQKSESPATQEPAPGEKQQERSNENEE